MTTVTLKFWHGGLFKKTGVGLQYMGGMGRTFTVDPDELCWFYLEELAKKCGSYRLIDEIFNLIPRQNLENGLRKVYADKEVFEMADIVIKNRAIDLYVLHGVDKPVIIDPKVVEKELGMDTRAKASTKHTLQPQTQHPKGLFHTSPTKKVSRPTTTPKKSPQRVNPPLTRSMTSPEKEGSHVKVPPKEVPHKEKATISTHLPHTQKPTKVNKCSTTEKTTPSQQIPITRGHKQADTTSPNTDQQNTDESDDLYDDRPDSPIPLKDLIGDYGSDSDSQDELYIPESEESSEDDVHVDAEADMGGSEFERIERGAEGCHGDTTDEEFQEAQHRVRGVNSRLFDIATQLQQEAAEGRLQSQRNAQNQSNVSEGSKEDNALLSEYEDSGEDCDTPEGSDDEGVGPQIRRDRKKVAIQKIDFSTFQWEAGQRFPSRQEFRAAVTRFAVTQGKDLYFCVSSNQRNQRLGVKCKSGCPFRLYASWDNKSAAFIVKSITPEHTCHRTMETNRQMKSTWLADQFLEVFKARPHWPAAEMIETVRRAYRVIIKKDKAYKIKYWAHKKLHGSMKDHYNKLGNYLEALKKASPHSAFVLEHNPTVKTLPPVFQRLFISFDGLSQGWLNGCRRVICVDGCFLKTFLGGQMLSAIGRDGNDQLFPLLWAVVEGECNESWEWFFVNLQRSTNAGDGAGWTVISDEHQGILNACAKVLPRAEHRHCARHVFANWHKKNRGDEVKTLFWKIVWAYNEADFNDSLAEMEKVSPSAVDDFKAHDPNVFCRAFFDTTTKCDVVTSNMTKTFNGYIIQARTKHLIYMLEDIRCALMQRLVVKRLEMEKCNAKVCPRVQAKLEKHKEEAAECYVMPSTQSLFGVSHKLDKLIVNLEEKTCTCRKWNLTGIPCSHAIACIFFMHKEAESYVHSYYLRETYLRAYSTSIPPIEGDRHWPKVDLDLLPPPIKIGPGRPRKNRRKDPYENPKKKGKLTRHGQVLSCSVCKSLNHTKRKCPDKGKEVQAAPKKPRGRPKKDGSNPTPRSEAESDVTAEPTRTGRGGRVIRGGRGSRGGGRGANRGGGGRGSIGGGKGSASRIPRGVGVFISSDGTPISNMPGQQGGPRVLSSEAFMSSQASCSNGNSLK